MRRLKFLVVLLFALGLSAAAGAQEVSVGGQVIMRLDSAAQAANVTRRIEAKLAAGADAKGILAKKIGRSYGIYWGETLLLEVTPELAAAKSSTAEGLAIKWAQQLYQAVGPGLVRLKPGKVVLPVGGQARVQVGGIATGTIAVSGGNGFVEVAVSQETEELVLTGRTVGKINLLVERDGGKTRLPIHIKDWAGYPPEKVQLRVTGKPAPGEMVAEASLQALVAKTRVNPGCRLSFDGGLPLVPSIPEGQTLRYELPIRISGGDNYYPVVRRVPIEVKSLDLEPVESNLLLVSNRPERVEEDGVLLEYEFSKREPCRLMYSHLNQTLAPRNLWVNLENPTSEPAEVLIGWTHAGPSRNEVHVGHQAAQRFLRQLGKEAGYSVVLEPRERYELAYHDMGRRSLVSGFVNLRLLKGEKLRVEVMSSLAPSRNSSRGLRRLGGPFNPFKIHPHGVFAQPFFEEWIDFTPGQEPIRVPYGKSPWLIDFETGLPNTGNFGVLYRYHFVVNNTTRERRRFSLIFHPTSGPAAGSFLVDGEVVSCKFRKRGVPAIITDFEVAPGQERSVDVVTLPEASSNYPAHIEIREANP